MVELGYDVAGNIHAEHGDGTMTTNGNDRSQLIDELRKDTMAVSLKLRRFGKRRSMTTDQVRTSAEAFGADPEYVGGSKRLLNDKHVRYKAVSAALSQARVTWKAMTVPFPEPGKRLMRRSKLAEFEAAMQSHVDALGNAVAALDEIYHAELIPEAQERLHDLFDESNYPQSLAGTFAVDWEYPSIEPPDYLKQMAPEIYEAEQRRIQARFDEAIAMTEQAFEAELASLVQSIQDQVTPQTVTEWHYEGPVQLELAQRLQELEAERDARQAAFDESLEENTDANAITEPVAGMMRQQRATLDAIAFAQEQQNLAGATELECKGAKVSWRPSGGGRKIKQLFDGTEAAEQWLTTRGCVKTGERQERRNMRADSMERLQEFLTRFQNLSVRSNDQLDALVEQARTAAEGVSAEVVNNEGEGAAQLRESLREAMAQIAASLDTMTVGDGRRHIDFSETVE